MEIERSKFFAKKNILRSIILIIICLPLLFGAILKFFYFLPKNENPITLNILNKIQNLISDFYYNTDVIQALWSISPTPNIENIISSSNILILIIFIGLLWGISSLQVGLGTIDKLSRAKRNARKKRLVDEYRNHE